MAIFEAEARRRTGEEDTLTSRVFGALRITDPATVTVPLLKRMGIDIEQDEVDSLELALWPQYGGTEPDVAITTKTQLAFIEAKLDSPSSAEQLEREYRQGKQVGKRFKLLLVTKDYRQPDAFHEAWSSLQREFGEPSMAWLRWQNLTAALKEIACEETIDSVSRRLLQAVVTLLEAKGLRGFNGIQPAWIETVSNSLGSYSALCKELSVLAQELANMAATRGLEMMTQSGVYFHCDGGSRNLFTPDNWYPKYFEWVFKDASWDFSQFWSYHLYVRLYLNTKEVWIGYALDASRTVTRDLLSRRALVLLESLREEPEMCVAFLRPPYMAKANIDAAQPATELTPQHFEENNLKKYYWIDFALRMSSAALGSPEALHTLVQRLIDVRDFVNRAELWPEPSEPAEAQEPAEIVEEETA